jgi:AcrR family transcriptional regulator
MADREEIASAPRDPSPAPPRRDAERVGSDRRPEAPSAAAVRAGAFLLSALPFKAMPGPRQLPFKSRMSAEARREVIEGVAVEAFAQRGYDGVSVDEIAAAADIKKATLYDHFASKQALYLHLLGEGARQMRQFIADRIGPADAAGPEERLRESLDAFLAFVEASPFSWRVMFREAPSDPELTEGAALVQEGARTDIVNLLRSLSPAVSEIPDQRLHVVAEGLKGARNGLALWWYEHPDVTREEIVDSVMTLAWPGIRQLITEAALERQEASLPAAAAGASKAAAPSAKRKARSSDQRAQIIEAAIGVFARRGYLGSSTERIAAAADVEPEVFDEHFEGLQDCLLQTYDLILEQASRSVIEAVPPEADWIEQTCAALRAVLGLVAEDPLRARVALVEIQTAGAPALARYEETLNSLSPYLARARELSPIADKLPETLDVAVLGGLAWFLQWRIVRGEVDQIEQLLPDLLSRAVEPYVGEEQAAKRIAAAIGERV